MMLRLAQHLLPIMFVAVLVACGSGALGLGGDDSSDDRFIGDFMPNVACDETSPAQKITSDISISRTLEAGCYFVTGQININNYAVLTIKPNTVIKFDRGAGFTTDNGNIIANGTPSAPIYFTHKDQDDWAGIRIYRRTFSQDMFNYVVIEYAGGESSWTHAQGAFNVIDDFSTTNSTKGRLTFTNSVIRNSGIKAKYAFFAQKNAYFDRIENNLIYGNLEYPMHVYADEAHFISRNNYFARNNVGNGLKQNFVVIAGNELNTSTSDAANFLGTVLWQRLNVPYFVLEDIEILNTILRIEPGTQINFEPNAGFSISTPNSALDANGQSGAPIRFTRKDESSAAWRGIQFTNTQHPQNRLNYTYIEYAGAHPTYPANVILNGGAQVSVNYSSIMSSSGYGFYLDKTSEFREFQYNRISQNFLGGGKVAASVLRYLDITSDYSGNIRDYIEVDFDDLSNETLRAINAPYAFFEDIYVTGKLIIEPGAMLLFAQGALLEFNGAGSGLTAVGTPQRRITFSSIAAFDETNPFNEYWKGLNFRNSFLNTLDYVDIDYAGYNDGGITTRAGIKIFSFPNSRGSAVSLNNSRILNLDSSWDIYVDSNSTLTGNMASNNNPRICYQSFGCF